MLRKIGGKGGAVIKLYCRARGRLPGPVGLSRGHRGAADLRLTSAHPVRGVGMWRKGPEGPRGGWPAHTLHSCGKNKKTERLFSFF